MKLTHDKPKKEGWYWYMDDPDGEPYPAKILKDKHGILWSPEIMEAIRDTDGLRKMDE